MGVCHCCKWRRAAQGTSPSHVRVSAGFAAPQPRQRKESRQSSRGTGCYDTALVGSSMQPYWCCYVTLLGVCFWSSEAALNGGYLCSDAALHSPERLVAASRTAMEGSPAAAHHAPMQCSPNGSRCCIAAVADG
ncbi:hypothetical protein ZWY2020_016192 [Hordeum vulgare]|nr:hypothetical protein ZWY2020_016192 [Hordeum vulgare]